MGIITYLRDQGVDADKAKKLSYDIFDEAKRRIRRSQVHYRVVAWFFIVIGFVAPIALFVLHSRIVIFSATPILGGVVLLGRLVNPPRLPE